MSQGLLVRGTLHATIVKREAFNSDLERKESLLALAQGSVHTHEHAVAGLVLDIIKFAHHESQEVCRHDRSLMEGHYFKALALLALQGLLSECRH